MADYGKKRGGTFSVPGHTGYPGGTIFAFDLDFEKFCDEQVKKLTNYKNDPNLFGYFSDNEMPLNVKNLTGYLSITNKQDPGYLAAKKWLIDKQSISEFPSLYLVKPRDSSKSCKGLQDYKGIYFLGEYIYLCSLHTTYALDPIVFTLIVCLLIKIKIFNNRISFANLSF